ncbi:hypothetical protein [Mycobacterium sp. OTB74]|uniref:WD40 domain-containing protein n=1 Tax=Mycobacterium sp. OTB74 TaxID=1853452 RepID=UPI0024759E5C|nr:hypothetical protein [Mycobacterium sp. OTB74]MDH6243481.1 WD40 repeat protein [Mycobacterium sp. OTB74]
MMTDELARRVVEILAGQNLPAAPTSADCSPSPHVESGVEPALLSLFCSELNEERKRRGQAKFDERLVEDAKHDTLSNYYASCVRNLPPSVARFIESELISEQGFRNNYVLEDAVPAHLSEDELNELIGSRLLRLEDRYDAPRIELTHDVLTPAVREHRDRRRVEEEKATLTKAAEQAEERERIAQEQTAVEERAKIEAQEQAQKLKKSTRALCLALVVALVSVVIAGFGWHNAWHERKEVEEKTRQADTDRLTAEGEAILAGKQPGSELSAFVKLIAAQHISPEHTNLGGLLDALNDAPRVQAIYPAVRAVSGNGQRVAYRGAKGIQLVDTQTWKSIGPPLTDLHRTLTGLSFTGRYLASFNADADKGIRVWDFDAGSYIGQQMLGTQDDVWDIAVSVDGRRVAAVDTNKYTVRLWDTTSGRLINTLQIKPDAIVYTLEFSPDGHHLATAGGEDNVRLWDAETGAALLETEQSVDDQIGPGDMIESLAFSPDGSVVAAGGQSYGLGPISGGEPLRLWNTNTGRLVATPKTGNYGTIRSLAFSPDGRRIATSSNERTVQLWDAGTGEPIRNPQSFQSQVRSVAFTDRGNTVVAVSGDDVEILAGDPDARLPVETAGSLKAAVGDYELFGLDGTTDSLKIEVLRGNVLQFFNVDTGQHVEHISSDTFGSALSVQRSRDGRSLAIVGQDNIIRVVDAATGKVASSPLKGHTDRINAVAFSPDGNTIASASKDGTLRIWDWRKGQQIGEPLNAHNGPVVQLMFSETGTHLFSRGHDGSVWIWDTTIRPPKAKQIGGPDSPDAFTAMVVSPDSRHIATASGKGTIQQWDVSSAAAEGLPLKGHPDEVNDIDYSPDGRYLVSVGNAGTDDTLRFWDLKSGREIGEPVSTVPMGKAAYVYFSKDGHWIYVIAQGMTLAGSGPTAGHSSIWRLPAPAEWEHALCQKLITNPNDDEWKAWVSPDTPYKDVCPGKPRA